MNNDVTAMEALLRRHGFRFSKSKGQNFLIDPDVPRAIAEASGAEEGSGVLEIGPGIGALSHELCRRTGKVVAVELDTALLPILDETMANYHNFKGDLRRRAQAGSPRADAGGVCGADAHGLREPAL